jgi:c-di-GMP-binding flagellar brake protein YcgR
MSGPQFQDTRPADLDGAGGSDPWAEFRVGHPQEQMRLLRELRDGNVAISLSAAGGGLNTTLWSVDMAQERLNFSVNPDSPQLARLLDADKAVAVAYLQNVKLQFELHDLTLVRNPQASTLQCDLPVDMYRFQRREYYRVRTVDRDAPTACLRHPARPEMLLALRVIDVSIGGCCLWLPNDVPQLPVGSRIGDVRVALDADTRFASGARLQHVTPPGHPEQAKLGVRMGFQWQSLPSSAERSLQRWIDRAQQQRRRLALGR